MVDNMQNSTHLNLRCSFKKCNGHNFRSVQELIYHFENECKFIHYSCIYCNWAVRRKDIGHKHEFHDYETCTFELKDHFNKLREKYSRH